MEKQLKKRGVKRKAAAILAVVMAIVISLGGTYMWKDYSQHKTNAASDNKAKYDVTLVENFHEQENWKVADGEVTKEVSVKNTGDVENGYGEAYVRIQLKEYFEIRPMDVEYTSERYMIGTGGDFIVLATKAEASSYFPDHKAVELTDAVSGMHGWFVQTQADDSNGQYGKFVCTKYELSNNVQHVVGETRADKDADVKHQIKANGECAYPIHLWNGTDLSKDVFAQPGADEYVKWILGDSGSVIMLSEWDGNPVKAWIIDDTAGNNEPWIYWGQLLAPGEETTDFLKAIELIKQPDGDFYYAIHVEMEAVSLDEMFAEKSEWTEAPDDVKNSYKENAPKVIMYEGKSGDGVLAQAAYTIKQGEKLTLDAAVKPDNANQNIGWSVLPDNGVISYVDGSFIITGEKSGEVTVTSASKDGKKAFVKITVSDEKTLWRQLQDLLDEAGKLDEDVYTPGSWTGLETAVALADGVTEKSPDNVIKSVIDAIDAAIDALERIVTPADNLNDAIEAGKDILGLPRDMGDDHSASGDDGANPYTPDSLDALQEAVENAEELLKKQPPASDTEINDAIDAIEDAISGLQPKADKDDLANLLAEANVKDEDDYTTDTWLAFEEALNNANAIYIDPNATENTVADAIDALRDAMDALKVRADQTELDALILEAQSKTPATNYTEDTWQALQDALDDAIDAQGDNSLDEDELALIVDALKDALDGLVNISGLLDAIAGAGALTEADFEADEWDDLQTALADAADAADRTKNATQAEIDAAEEAIRDAIAALVPVGTAQSLTDAIAAYGGAGEGDYTISSWASSGYEDALDAANALVTLLNDADASNDPSPSQIKAAIEALTDAYNDLVLRGDPTEINAAAASIKTDIDGNQVKYTADSWSAMQTAMTNAGNGNLDTSDLSQAQVDALKPPLLSAYNALIDISGLTAALATAGTKVQDDYTPASWTDLANARAAAEIIAAKASATQEEVDTAISGLNTAMTNLVYKPVVNTFSVSASGAATQAAKNTDIKLYLNEKVEEQVITLTGIVGGSHLSNDPGQTSWTSVSGPDDWLKSEGDSATVKIEVPSDTNGTLVIKANAKDNTDKKLNITVYVTDYSLTYSDGGLIMGSEDIGGNAYTETLEGNITVNMTTPIGNSTIRYFATSGVMPSEAWTISDTDKGHNATLSSITNNKAYKVSIPKGFNGDAVLKVGAYEVTFHVTENAEPSSSLRAGDTFAASGIEWRVVYRESATDMLVISEHVLDKKPMHNVELNWDTATKWEGSDLRTALNDSTYTYSFGNLESSFQSKILDTKVNTRIGATNSRYGGYEESSEQKLFMLSEEEVLRTIVYNDITTDAVMDLSKNLYGDVILFADDNSRMANYSNGSPASSNWWLRSPRGALDNAAVVELTRGISASGRVSIDFGVRPALRINP
jgi:hypothetical protein